MSIQEATLAPLHAQESPDHIRLSLAAAMTLGFVPGWPGEEVYPPQPMLGQTRAVLEQYKAKGGAYWEKVIADTGHCPYVEKPDEFAVVLLEHLRAAKG